MAVRFDAAARRAIDLAMTEVENRNHATLDSIHLLLGLLQTPDSAVARACTVLGVSSQAVHQEALSYLKVGQGSGSMLTVEIAGIAEDILQRASILSIERGGDVVTDLDIFIALAERDDTSANRLLRKVGLTAPKLTGAQTAAALLTTAPSAGRPDQASASARNSPMAAASITTTRVGIGYDSHRFAEGGPLVLGGIAIPGDIHLAGHSDGDAIAHALTDAILGAAALGDIGEMFSDTDPANRGRHSLEMLAAGVARARAAGWMVQQVDVVVVTEALRIAPHRAAMAAALAGALGVEVSAVSIKGKTNEGMGWIGRGEGIACMAVATLVAAVRGAA